MTQPNTLLRRWRQHLIAPPAAVFPLLCPVREADWVPGWKATVHRSRSGVAEAGCVFTTSENAWNGAPEDSVWVISDHVPPNQIALIKVTPGRTVCRIAVTLTAEDDGCVAEVSYDWTALSPDGRDALEKMTEEAWSAMMRGWETHLNAYLRKRARPWPTSP